MSVYLNLTLCIKLKPDGVVDVVCLDPKVSMVINNNQFVLSLCNNNKLISIFIFFIINLIFGRDELYFLTLCKKVSLHLAYYCYTQDFFYYQQTVQYYTTIIIIEVFPFSHAHKE